MAMSIAIVDLTAVNVEDHATTVKAAIDAAVADGRAVTDIEYVHIADQKDGANKFLVYLTLNEALDAYFLHATTGDWVAQVFLDDSNTEAMASHIILRNAGAQDALFSFDETEAPKDEQLLPAGQALVLDNCPHSKIYLKWGAAGITTNVYVYAW